MTAIRELATLLVVDNNPNNVMSLKQVLEESGYHVLVGRDGHEGWDVLQHSKHDVKAIMLNCMAPNLNDGGLIQKMKQDDSVSSIPVIMQTKATEIEQVIQSIPDGIYYYLTKPFEREAMFAVVSAAVRNYSNLSNLRKEMNGHKAKLHIVKESCFEVCTLEDVRYLTTFLSNFFPDPSRVLLGISELLINAVEHGNLGITYEEKSRLMQNNLWEQEVRKRLALPKNAGKKVLVQFRQMPDHIALAIKDDGSGFDWANYMEISPDRATHIHGRGIALSRMLSFDEMEYIGTGNEVQCKVYTKELHNAESAAA